MGTEEAGERSPEEQRIGRVTTKAGDEGRTALVDGSRVGKDDPRIEAMGAVDELASVVGRARAQGLDDRLDGWLAEVQHQLFVLGSDLATPPGTDVPRVEEEHVDRLETILAAALEELPPLEEFILPGGGPAGADLHLARAVCRRAERRVVALARTGENAVGPRPIVHLNRLSDVLFCLGRLANRAAGAPEIYAEFSRRRAGRLDPEEDG